MGNFLKIPMPKNVQIFGSNEAMEMCSGLMKNKKRENMGFKIRVQSS